MRPARPILPPGRIRPVLPRHLTGPHAATIGDIWWLALQCSSSLTQPEDVRHDARRRGRHWLAVAAAIAAEHAGLDGLKTERLQAEQELIAQLHEAPDSPEVVLLQQKLASIRRDAVARRQRAEELRQQTPGTAVGGVWPTVTGRR